MRTLLFAASFAAGLVPAMAQDDDQTPPATHKPVVHHYRAVRTAAAQAPAPQPRAVAGTPKTSSKMTQAAAQQNPAAVLQQFTLSDLQAALADAQAQTPPDTIAANCYSELITVVQSPAINPLPSQLGAFTAFQKARDLKNIVVALQQPNGPLSQLNVACAPLAVDTQTTLINLGIIGGAVVGTGGLLGIP